MNNKTLQQLVKGCYGRKIAYTSVDHIDANNVISVVNDTIGIFNRNRMVCEYLWRYKNGDQPIRYRNKTIRDDVCNNVVENHAWEIVQFKNGQTNGEPIQYISRKKDESISDLIDKLNDYVAAADKQVRDISSGEWTSAVGTGFKAIQRKDGDVPFRITVPTPLNTYIVYSRYTDEPMLAVQRLKDENNEQFFLCFDERFEYRIKNGQLIVNRLHMFGGIPIVEYPNNQDRISDIELVIDMLDAINNYQSNRVDAVEQFVQSFIKFVNCEIDDTLFKEMKQSGAIMVNSTSDKQADVDIMTQELNQTETQVAKQDILDNIASILGIPNKEGGGSKSGDSQGAVELREGWDHAKQRAGLKDPYIIESEKRLAKIIINEIQLKKGKNELPLSMFDVDVKISHSPTDNLYVKANSLMLLLQAGVDPKIAIKTSGLWSDSEKVYTQSRETLDIKQGYKEGKKADDVANIDNRLKNGNT